MYFINISIPKVLLYKKKGWDIKKIWSTLCAELYPREEDSYSFPSVYSLDKPSIFSPDRELRCAQFYSNDIDDEKSEDADHFFEYLNENLSDRFRPNSDLADRLKALLIFHPDHINDLDKKIRDQLNIIPGMPFSDEKIEHMVKQLLKQIETPFIVGKLIGAHDDDSQQCVIEMLAKFCNILPKNKHQNVCESLLYKLEDSNESIRSTTINTLTQLAPYFSAPLQVLVIEALFNTLFNDTNMTKETAGKALLTLLTTLPYRQPAIIFDQLHEALDSSNETIKKIAIQIHSKIYPSLSSKRKHQFVDQLISNLRNDDIAVRLAAAISLNQLPLTHDEKQQLLLRLIRDLSDDDIIVRKMAAEVLGELSQLIAVASNEMQRDILTTLIMALKYNLAEIEKIIEEDMEKKYAAAKTARTIGQLAQYFNLLYDDEKKLAFLLLFENLRNLNALMNTVTPEIIIKLAEFFSALDVSTQNECVDLLLDAITHPRQPPDSEFVANILNPLSHDFSDDLVDKTTTQLMKYINQKKIHVSIKCGLATALSTFISETTLEHYLSLLKDKEWMTKESAIRALNFNLMQNKNEPEQIALIHSLYELMQKDACWSVRLLAAEKIAGELSGMTSFDMQQYAMQELSNAFSIKQPDSEKITFDCLYRLALVVSDDLKPELLRIIMNQLSNPMSEKIILACIEKTSEENKKEFLIDLFNRLLLSLKNNTAFNMQLKICNIIRLCLNQVSPHEQSYLIEAVLFDQLFDAKKNESKAYFDAFTHVMMMTCATQAERYLSSTDRQESLLQPSKSKKIAI